MPSSWTLDNKDVTLWSALELVDGLADTWLHQLRVAYRGRKTLFMLRSERASQSYGRYASNISQLKKKIGPFVAWLARLAEYAPQVH